jgi:NAD(P)-dependent dehydrogenase (short-subunit alcohol dehydrogenase family)
MLTVRYATAYPRMRINAVEPGFTATDLNGHTGARTVEQSAEIIVRPDGPTGGFFGDEGSLPW